MMDKVNICQLEILTAKNQQELISFLLNDGQIKSGKLIAINAEKVVLSKENPELFSLLSQAEYKYADGISIICSIKKKYPQYSSLERIAGADLWLGLMQASCEYQIPVFILGGDPQVIEQTKQKLLDMKVNIVGNHNGYFSGAEEDSLIESIKRSGAKLVTVALGSPKQELFMQKAQERYPNTLYMGVGGSYDVFVGKVKRAPLVWQQLGLEWLYRVLHQPTRWRRQVRLVKYAYYHLTNQL